MQSTPNAVKHITLWIRNYERAMVNKHVLQRDHLVTTMHMSLSHQLWTGRTCNVHDYLKPMEL